VRPETGAVAAVLAAKVGDAVARAVVVAPAAKAGVAHAAKVGAAPAAKVGAAPAAKADEARGEASRPVIRRRPSRVPKVPRGA
jgi:hypothetical protein